jgi:hypothetical protein
MGREIFVNSLSEASGAQELKKQWGAHEGNEKGDATGFHQT